MAVQGEVLYRLLSGNAPPYPAAPPRTLSPGWKEVKLQLLPGARRLLSHPATLHSLLQSQPTAQAIECIWLAESMPQNCSFLEGALENEFRLLPGGSGTHEMAHPQLEKDVSEDIEPQKPGKWPLRSK